MINKNILMLSVVVLIFAFVFNLGGIASLIYTGSIEVPAHIVACGTNRYNCEAEMDYKYKSTVMNVYQDYDRRCNVEILNTREQYDSFEDNDQFRFYEKIHRYGGEERSLKVYALDKGIKPQIKCDGTKDCSFGYTNEYWELKDDGLCYVKGPTKEIPQEIPNTDEDEEPQQNYDTEEPTFFGKINLWIQNLFDSIFGVFR